MADKCGQSLRRCRRQKKSCHRRVRHQRQHLAPRARFLFGPTASLLSQCRRRQYSVEKELQCSWDKDDEVAIDSEDLQVMRDSVDSMQQQLRRGLRDIQEIRALVKQAVAQREFVRRADPEPTIVV